MLADRFVQLDAARLLVEWVGMVIDDERPAARAAARTAEAAAADALQAHGGIGFTWEHPSHVFLKRARAPRSLLGSPAQQLDTLAGHIFETLSSQVLH
jgi:alkylation response protein AidB-like acyl-CoA dehydrogenase